MKCSELKQIPSPKDRLVPVSDTTSCEFNKCMRRSEFSRDRDRILFSKAFRRLQHKGQVYSFEEGDHFRTRLTHTLEVTEIAKTLSNALEVDIDLTEAIALGHDIGHAPFGHQGERTLDQIMKGYDPLEGRNIIKIPIDHRGFKHNYTSVRILHNVEKKDEKSSGLNLTWQVLEGIFKHTSIHRDKKELEKYGDWDIEWLMDGREKNELKEKLYVEQADSVSIEGQIVAIADEITQRQHDLDDGLRDQSSGLRIGNLYGNIIDEIDILLSDYTNKLDENSEKQNLRECLKTMKKLKETLESKKQLDIEIYSEYNTTYLRNYIIKYFLTDVVNTTRYNVDKLHEGIDYEKINGVTIIKKKVVSFSKIGEDFNNKLHNIIKDKILKSFKINRFDGKSQYIVRRLFKAYYVNPLQMHDDVLKKIENAVKKNSAIYQIKLKPIGNDKKLAKIDFKTGNSEEIRILIETLKLENIEKNLQTPQGFGENCYKCLTSENIEETSFKYCLLKNNYAFLSTICYHISGMTDSYAKQQFKELYLLD